MMSEEPLPQAAMIERLRELCEKEERLVAAMLYGSFTHGEGDRFSDIDVVLFFADERLAEIEPARWLGGIAPVELHYLNEFGNHVAIFDNLVRGEFHFDRARDIPKIAAWDRARFPSMEATLILDRSGRLREQLQGMIGDPVERGSAQEVGFLASAFLNWHLFGSNVLERGEHARAIEIMGLVQDQLLRMARIIEGTTAHWLTPTKALERELSAGSYARLAACEPPLEPHSIRRAYAAAWEWGIEMLDLLAARYEIELPRSLMARMQQRLVDANQGNQVSHPE